MNQIVTDLGLKAQMALLDDPRTRRHSIRAFEENGVVTLRGSVPSLEISEAAESIVKDVFGVRGVINELEVKAANKTSRA